MAKLNKRSLSLFLIWTVIIGLVSVAYVCIPFPKNEASAVAFAFALSAITAAFAVFVYAFANRHSWVSRFYSIPIIRVGIVYSAVQFAFSVVICIVGAFVDIPTWVALVFSLLILAVGGICFTSADASRDIIERIEKTGAESTAMMTSLRVTSASLVDRASDTEVKKALSKLADDFRFSDPVSSAATQQEEQSISEHLAALEGLLSGTDKGAIVDEIGTINKLLADRNRKCLLNKK